MKRIIYFSFVALILTSFRFVAQGQNITLRQTNESGIYKKGQKISVIAFTGKQVGDSLSIRVFKNNNQTLVRTTIMIHNDSILVYEGSFGEPCSIIVEARSKAGNTSLGMVVGPDKLKPGADRPKDFKSYWDNQKKSLKEMPLNVKTTPVDDKVIEKGFSCVDIEINCTGPKPARGYFAKPVNASPKSLPVVLLVHAAGVKGSWCRSEPKNALDYAKMGTLCFDLNAHGMLNGQPESYYADLEKSELRNYYLQGVTSRDDFYFKGMYLRLLRTIDFLTQQPEWDGKRILVIGESQGGGQALIAAGLDKRVSAVVAIVPAMCDWLAPLANRKGGWPQPYETDASKEEMLKTLPYFDAANILKGSKAIIFAEIGLIDMTCPSTSVYTAINQAKGEKIIYAVPYRPHQAPQNSMTKTWEETVYKPRELYIRNYLK
jgi:cephalosporin-C deacetylase-like acetyl esterase